MFPSFFSFVCSRLLCEVQPGRILLHLPDDRLLLSSKGPEGSNASERASAISSPATGMGDGSLCLELLFHIEH